MMQTTTPAVGPNPATGRATRWSTWRSKTLGQEFPKSTLKKIFEPFFTTKPAGKGTGLGLPVTKQIVDMHRGVLKIRNANEGGAVVTITFTQPVIGN